MNRKIDFKNIFVNPIDNFSKYIMSNLDEPLNLFFEKEMEDTKPNHNLIDKCDSEIKLLKEEIEQRKISDKISSLQFWNAIIFILFFLLIGFFFWSIYKKNKNIIDAFCAFKKEKIEHINKLIYIKCNQVFASFSTIALKDIYSFIFEHFGINAINNFSQSTLFKEINDKELIDIYSGITGIVKNSPFYDVVARKLVYREVEYSTSETFYYTYYYDGKSHTGSETLTAYYYENTPFIDEKNLLIYKTNYLKDLTISTNNSSYDKNILLENKDFIKLVKVVDYSNRQSDLSQFFTIQTQENFVKWYQLQKSNVFNFLKVGDRAVVQNSTYDFDSLKKINKTLDSLQLVNYNEHITFDLIKSKIKKIVFSYFDRFTKMLQIPLLVPGISREWYRKNGNYLIASDSNLEVQEIEKIDLIEPIDSIDKFLDPKFYSFKSKEIPKKPIWFTTNKVIKENDCQIAILDMRSFRSEKHYENVAVHGFRVGTKVITVEYDKFFPMEEKKMLIVFYKSFKTTSSFIIGKNLKNIISENHYVNKEFYNLINQEGIWTNDPRKFENSQNNSLLIQFAKEFNNINDKLNLEASLRLDEHGIYISVNNYDVVDEKVYKTITNIIRRFSNVNFFN